MERAGFLQSTSAGEDGHGFKPCCATYRPTERLAAPFYAVDRALPAIRAVVCAPARGGLCALRHVWFRRHYFGLADCRIVGNTQEEQALGATSMPRVVYHVLYRGRPARCHGSVPFPSGWRGQDARA